MTIAALDLKSQINASTMTDRELAEGQAACGARAREIAQIPAKDKRSLTAAEMDEADNFMNRSDLLGQEIENRKRQSKLMTRANIMEQGGQLIPTSGTEDPQDPVNNPDPGKYSVMRAIDCIASNRRVDGYEGEISQEIAKRMGRSSRGFFMPMNLRMRAGGPEKRADMNGTAAAGLIQNVYDPTVLDYLRHRRILSLWGATVLSDLVGVFKMPRKTGTSGAYWVSSGSNVTQTTMTTDVMTMQASTCGASTRLLRETLTQPSYDVETLVRQDLFDTLGLELDRVGLNGSGVGAQPEGLAVASNVPTHAIGDDGGDPSRNLLITLESMVETANADFGNLKYVTSARGKAMLKSKQVVSGVAAFLWSDMNDVNGYKGLATNHIPSNITKGDGQNLTQLFFGNGEDILLGLWGAADVIVDPFSESKSGTINVTVLQDADVGFRRLASFARCLDMATTLPA
jgi:HK97 family phage major capsid protein